VAWGMPFAAGVLEFAEQLLLLGVDTDRRLPSRHCRADRVVDMPKPGVAIGMLVALKRLACRRKLKPSVGLSRRATRSLPAWRPWASCSARLRTLFEGYSGQPVGIPPDVIPDQRRKSSSNPESLASAAGAPSALTPDPARSQRLGLVKLQQALTNRVLLQPEPPPRSRHTQTCEPQTQRTADADARLVEKTSSR